MFITDKTQGEDEAYYLLEFEGGALGIIENIWGQRGEMDDNRSLRCGRLSMLEQWADELVFQFAAAFIRCAYENGDPL
jgi:hypothetical protein